MTATDDLTSGLADRLKDGTWALHREAERSGILHRILTGRCGLDGYVLLLRNLLPVYDALEGELKALRPGSAASSLVNHGLFRAAALRSDLKALSGDGWADLDALPPAQQYANRIVEASRTEPCLLIAHAYVRYLGDLNGGQILRRLLGRVLHLEPEQLSFYAFPAFRDTHAFASAYRDAIDRAGTSMRPDFAMRIVEEARIGFRLNIDLSEAVSHRTP